MIKKISKDLNGVIAQMLKPLKGLSLSVVIEGLSGYKVMPFDNYNEKDKELLKNLCRVAKETAKEINKNGIVRTRPNEVGNDIEPLVKQSLNNNRYKAETPCTKSGKKKSTGYPDIVFTDKYNQINYLECKTFNINNINTTQRSFYLSPSSDFKVTKTAHHFGICFEIFVFKNKVNKRVYKCKSWKILDLSKLKVDVKYEFNSDNNRMYNKKIILREGKIKV